MATKGLWSGVRRFIYQFLVKVTDTAHRHMGAILQETQGDNAKDFYI